MTSLALTVILIVVGVILALTTVVWLAVPVFLFALIALIWAIVAVSRGRTQKVVMHQTEDVELLGPGGPDDPPGHRADVGRAAPRVDRAVGVKAAGDLVSGAEEAEHEKQQQRRCQQRASEADRVPQGLTEEQGDAVSR